MGSVVGLQVTREDGESVKKKKVGRWGEEKPSMRKEDERRVLERIVEETHPSDPPQES